MRSTKPVERLNRKIERRTEVVGIPPNEAAMTRLAGAIAMEQSDERTRRALHDNQDEGLQAAAMSFRARDLPVGQRPQTVNALRGHLAE